MKILSLVLLPMVSWLALQPKHASCGALCTCGWETDAVKARDGAAVVLDGLALDSTLTAPSIRDARGIQWFQVRVVVRSVWKGSVGDTIVVRTTEPTGGCGFYFVAGQRYLLFLDKDAARNLLGTTCSLSQPFSQADSIIRKLGPPLRRGAA